MRLSNRQLGAEILERILDRFQCKNSGVKMAFGYGSAVFPQKGNEPSANKSKKGSSNMVDICLVVEDTKKFHNFNLHLNMHHYCSTVRLIDLFASRAQSANFVNNLQHLPCSVYFNTLVQLDECTVFKYGVISMENLIRDLST